MYRTMKEKRNKGGKMKERKPFTVKMSSVGNPDFNQNPRKPMSPPAEKRAYDLTDASLLCMDYINYWDLGGGNWTGGKVFKDGKQIARVSYNGRVWDMQGKEIKI